MTARREARSARNSAGPTVYLHIGVPKSGTTYLQSRFAQNAEAAAQQGLLWPGPQWGHHVEAVRDLRRLRPGSRLDSGGPWMRLAGEARAWTGAEVLISMEWLTGCTPLHARTAVETLGAERVEVVCTARDLLRCFAAQWQEMTKNLHEWSWRQFVEEIVEEKDGPAAQRFWNQQDIPAVLRKWADTVGWDRVHLVTVPPSGADPELLWTRFCSVLKIDGTAFAQPKRDNESLGVVSSTLMHKVNLAAIEQGVGFTDYQRIFHLRLADQVLAPRRDAEEPIAVSADVDAWLRTRAQRLVDELLSLDVEVVGDLADLLPGKALQGREPDDVTDGELLDVAVEALVGLATNEHATIQELRSRQQELRRRLARLGGDG